MVVAGAQQAHFGVLRHAGHEDHLAGGDFLLHVRRVAHGRVRHLPLQGVAADLAAQPFLLGFFTQDQQAPLRRIDGEVHAVTQPHPEHNQQYLRRHAHKQPGEILAEEDQVIVLVLVDVHDLQLQIRHQIRGQDGQGHGGNHRLALLLAHGIAAVDRVHGHGHGHVGHQRGAQGTGWMPQLPVVHRHQAEEQKRQAPVHHHPEKAHHQRSPVPPEPAEYFLHGLDEPSFHWFCIRRAYRFPSIISSARNPVKEEKCQPSRRRHEHG